VAATSPTHEDGTGRVWYLQTAESGDGAVHEQRVDDIPGSPFPPSHLHPAQDEHFEVEQGRMLFVVDGAERIRSAGETLDIPPAPHTGPAMPPNRRRPSYGGRRGPPCAPPSSSPPRHGSGMAWDCSMPGCWRTSSGMSSDRPAEHGGWSRSSRGWPAWGASPPGALTIAAERSRPKLRHRQPGSQGSGALQRRSLPAREPDPAS
jgi:hypothetical protein